MSNHSVIAHRANYHYFKLEEDYVLICQGGKQYPQCKAAILAVLEHWMNDKKAKGQELYVYLTYPEWIDALYGLFRRNHIMACLNELVSEGLITRRPCRRGGKDSYEYTLNTSAIAKRLAALPERVEKYTRPNLNASKFKRVQIQTGTGLNLNASTRPNLNASEQANPSKFKRNIDSITEIPSSIDSVRENENARALSEKSHLVFVDDRNHWYHSSCVSGHYGEAEGMRLTAVGIEQAPQEGICSMCQSNIHLAPFETENDTHSYRQEDTITEGRISSFRTGVPEPPASGTETAIANIPRTPGESPPSGESRQSRPRPTDGAATGVEAGEPRASGVTWESILDDWDVVQGHHEARTDRIIKAAKEAVTANPTRDELRGCRDWLPKTDRPEKPWYGLRGVAFWDVIEKLGAYRSHLALSIEPAPLADVPKPKPMDIYTANSLNKEKMDRRIAEMRANIARKGLRMHDGTQP